MKTNTLSLQLILAIFFLFSTGLVKAQSPCPPVFSPPPCAIPPSNPPPPPPPPNPPTNDKRSGSGSTSSTPAMHIPLCNDCIPGGTYVEGGEGYIPDCIYENIQKTGNDIQVVQWARPLLIAQAMVWDSECPAFSLVVSENPYSQSPLNASFVAELDGGKQGVIRDPDIIISQQPIDPSEAHIFEILIVYEYTDFDGNQYIAFEQWHYNYISKTIKLVSPQGSPSQLTNSGGSNPNIDANNENQVAVVFEEGGNIYSYVNYIASPTTFNSNDIIDISHCVGSSEMITPDVSISDDNGGANNNFKSVVSYVFNHGSNLYLVQEEFNYLDTLSPSKDIRCTKFYNLSSNYVNPRIASPYSLEINNKWECAVAAVNTNQNIVSVFHNYSDSIAYSSHDLNSDPISLQLLLNCPNTMPAITYTGTSNQDDHSVTVAWTFWDCLGMVNNSQEVFAVNYNLASNIRTPAHPDYFMPVNLMMVGDQYAPSVASTGYIGSGDVFYSLASDGPDMIIYKMSNVFSQPLLRKKEEQENKTPKVRVFPNPAQRMVNLDLSSIDKEQMEVLVFDMDGKKVLEKTIFNKHNMSQIDLRDCKPGIYFMEIKAEGFTHYEKIILE